MQFILFSVNGPFNVSRKLQLRYKGFPTGFSLVFIGRICRSLPRSLNLLLMRWLNLLNLLRVVREVILWRCHASDQRQVRGLLALHLLEGPVLRLVLRCSAGWLSKMSLRKWSRLACLRLPCPKQASRPGSKKRKSGWGVGQAGFWKVLLIYLTFVFWSLPR